MKSKIILCAALTLGIAGCATVDKKEYDQLAKQAEDEVKIANKTGFLWKDTEKVLKESKEAMAAAEAASDRTTRQTNFDKAMKLAKRALQEAKLAQQQAKDNANAKPDYN